MQSLPDIAGTGVAVALASPNVTARTVMLSVVGSGSVRIGGPSTGAANGVALTAATSPLVLPVMSQDGHSTSPYSLAGMNAYIPIGTSLSVAYEPFD